MGMRQVEAAILAEARCVFRNPKLPRSVATCVGILRAYKDGRSFSTGHSKLVLCRPRPGNFARAGVFSWVGGPGLVRVRSGFGPGSVRHRVGGFSSKRILPFRSLNLHPSDPFVRVQFGPFGFVRFGGPLDPPNNRTPNSSGRAGTNEHRTEHRTENRTTCRCFTPSASYANAYVHFRQ